MQGYIEPLRAVDFMEFSDNCETEAELFESKFVQLFSDDSESGAPKVPVFDFAPMV